MTTNSMTPMRAVTPPDDLFIPPPRRGAAKLGRAYHGLRLGGPVANGAREARGRSEVP